LNYIIMVYYSSKGHESGQRGKGMITHRGSVALKTDRLILRGLRREDAEAVFRNWASDEEVARFMRWAVHTDVQVTEQWLMDCEEIALDPTRYEWGIILAATNEPIGSIGAFVNAEEPDRYEVGYCLSKKYWCQGYATEALLRVMEFLVKTVGLSHFICSHALDNPASGAVMRHAGFHPVRDGLYESFDGLRKFESKVYYLDTV